jgi:hypothetical protein
VERPCGPWGRGLLAGIDVPILLMVVDPENSARSGGIGSRRCDRGRPRRIRGRPGAWSPKDPPRPVRRSRAARSSPPGPHRGNHRHRRPTGTEPGRGSQGRRRHPGSRRPARSRPGSSILQVAWRRADQAIRLHTLRRADLDGEPIKNSKIKFNVHSWDLKSPAFRRPLPVRRDRAGADGWPGTWGGISEGLGRTERVTEEPLQSESYLWSGFQPTAEPTAFQAVVVQFSRGDGYFDQLPVTARVPSRCGSTRADRCRSPTGSLVMSPGSDTMSRSSRSVSYRYPGHTFATRPGSWRVAMGIAHAVGGEDGPPGQE